MLEILQNALTILATATGIYVAIGGLNAWRRETTGKRDIELCQTVIERFYEAEHKMALLRSPMSYSNEGADRAKPENEKPHETERRNSLFVPLARMNLQSEFWSDFFSYKFRMRALFGEKAVAAFNTVEDAYRSFRAVASVRYSTLFDGDEARLDRSTRNDFDATIWEGLKTPDKIAGQMAKAIVEMEAICVPIVRSAGGSPWKWWQNKRIKHSAE